MSIDDKDEWHINNSRSPFKRFFLYILRHMYSPPLTSFLMTSTDDDLRRCDLTGTFPMLTGDEMESALEDDDALRTIPVPAPAATTALSRIEDSVLENLRKICSMNHHILTISV